MSLRRDCQLQRLYGFGSSTHRASSFWGKMGDMNRGAIAIVDALGFKGIWGNPRQPSLSVLQTLKAIGTAARTNISDAAPLLDRRNLPHTMATMLKSPFIRVVQLSDTIVVAAGRRPRLRKPRKRTTDAWKKSRGLTLDQVEEIVDGYMLYLVGRCVCSILKTAALCQPALVYRGAVTIGRFAIDENFILGPAVDEAAELMDMADGPFVWLTPLAHRPRYMAVDADGPAWKDIALEYEVPLKNGRVLPTRVMNPLLSCSSEEKKKVEANILEAMNSPQVDVAVKRANAKTFFDFIRRAETAANTAGPETKDSSPSTG